MTPFDHLAPPRIVCLCGSTRFMQAFQDASLAETLAGRIVLSVGCDTKGEHDLAVILVVALSALLSLLLCLIMWISRRRLLMMPKRRSGSRFLHCRRFLWPLIILKLSRVLLLNRSPVCFSRGCSYDSSLCSFHLCLFHFGDVRLIHCCVC